MSVSVYSDGSYYQDYHSGECCIICGDKTGRCSKFYKKNASNNDVLYFVACHFKSSEHSMPKLPGYYKHYVTDVEAKRDSEFKILPDIKETIITKGMIELRDKVYKAFEKSFIKRQGFRLYDDDRDDLYRRGLNDEAIARMGIFSVPDCDRMVWSSNGDRMIKLETAIMKDLLEQFEPEDLIKVPGFLKRKSKFGGEYVGFKSSFKNGDQFQKIRGYFVPYHNIEGKRVAMQYRLSEVVLDEKGKALRYFWYSSKQATSSSPADHYIPSNVKREDVLIVIEGALKEKTACERLGFLGLAVAGVLNTRRAMKNIALLEKILNRKFIVIVAYDMDKYEKKPNGSEHDALLGERKLCGMLKATGNQVYIAEWDRYRAKGIDDATQLGLKLTYNKI